jgi:hypothetical protein
MYGEMFLGDGQRRIGRLSCGAALFKHTIRHAEHSNYIWLDCFVLIVKQESLHDSKPSGLTNEAHYNVTDAGHNK